MKTAESALATRRSRVKRYLAIVGVKVSFNATTDELVQSVRQIHRERTQKHGHINKAWPQTNGMIQKAAKECHYLNQLISMKICFGLNASIGCVHENGTVQCKSVADLVRIGWTSKKYLYLDANLHNLETL